MKIVFRPETPGFLDLSLTPFTGPLEDESLLAPRIFVDGSPLERILGSQGIPYDLSAMRDASSGWKYCLRSDSGAQMSDWPSVAGVGWAVIALSQDLKSHFWNP